MDLTASQLADWGAYYEVEPFGSLIQNAQVGRLTALVANAIAKKKSRRAYDTKDFTFGMLTSGLKSSARELTNSIMSGFAASAKRVSKEEIAAKVAAKNGKRRKKRKR